jgi:hypothetical protein
MTRSFDDDRPATAGEEDRTSDMHAAETAHDEEFQLNLPKDLLTELDRRPVRQRNDMHVESMKPSLLGRVVEIFAGKRPS